MSERAEKPPDRPPSSDAKNREIERLRQEVERRSGTAIVSDARTTGGSTNWIWRDGPGSGRPRRFRKARRPRRRSGPGVVSDVGMVLARIDSHRHIDETIDVALPRRVRTQRRRSSAR